MNLLICRLIKSINIAQRYKPKPKNRNLKKKKDKTQETYLDVKQTTKKPKHTDRF